MHEVLGTTGIVLNPYDNAVARVQPKQDDFLANGAKYKLMGGAQGGGKSRACRMEGFRSCEIIPRCKGLVLRRSRPEVIKNFVEPLIEETRVTNADGTSQPYLRWLSSKNRILFPNGSVIDIGYCEAANDVERYRGLEYDWICIEELNQWQEEWWRKIMTSLRTTKAGVRPFFFGSTNPGGVGHGWVKRLWITQQYHENENADEYGTIRATVYDNPALMKADPEYLRNLMSLPEKERRARMDGDWDVFEGQFFSEYREKWHVVDPIYPDTGIKRRILAFDYGYKNPLSAGWYALTNQGHVYRYRELYGAGMLYGDMARRIAAMTKEDEIIDLIVGDPAALEKPNESTGTSLRDEFSAVANELGIPWLKKIYPANNNRKDGWMTVRKYLQVYTDPNTGAQYSPLHITRNCAALIRTLPDLVHDKRNVEDLDSNGEDHACFPESVFCETEDGMLSIRSIRVGDVIRTATGWSRVKGAQMTGDREIWECTFDGGKIEGTGDHPIFTKDRGFIPLQYLCSSDKVIVCKASNSTASNTFGMGNTTDATKETMGRDTPFIGQSGKRRTGRSLLDGTSITKTAIRGIMRLKILKRLVHRIMLLCTITSRSLNPSLNNGMGARKDESGMERRQEECGQNENKKNIPVRCVGKASKLTAHILRNFVISIARCGTTINLECRAVRNLQRIGKEKVYNISTEDGSFYANSVLVKNCDELRYALMEIGISIATMSDVQQSNAALKKENRAEGMTPKERELRSRGITRSKSILDKRF